MTEPSSAGPAGARRWADYLDWLRADVAGAVCALTAEQQRTTLVPSGWTPLELLSHVLHMEQRWFRWLFLGEDVADPWGDWDVDQPWRDDVEGRWHVPDGVTADDLSTRLEAVGARTREVLATYPLDAAGAPSPRWDGDPPTLEWICFHVVTEYARHAGHLDIVVELGS